MPFDQVVKIYNRKFKKQELYECYEQYDDYLNTIRYLLPSEAQNFVQNFNPHFQITKYKHANPFIIKINDHMINYHNTATVLNASNEETYWLYDEFLKVNNTFKHQILLSDLTIIQVDFVKFSFQPIEIMKKAI